ncbi:ashwin-like [Ostrinia furnacalis]|uniref:ashwin-like n=1 Tax=Ostrinia furnacalis TaxID=93504 RepID=UPI00103A813F|nr:ashwin-like [Ostrinia furnacalis]
MAVSCEMLLHPELLSNEQLLYIIKERRLNISNLESMARYELLDIFHQFCLPYGQRKYRDTGRGRILNKARQSSPEPVAKLITINSSQYRKLVHLETSDRLKPPPDLFSGNLKNKKIDIKPQPALDLNILKRTAPIDSKTEADESPPSKKSRKPITWP